MDKYKNRKYDIVSYNENWPKEFTKYADIVRGIFSGEVQIEHVGSTAVPGMAGKPAIDVLVIVPNLEMVEEKVAAMEQAGFTYAGQFVKEGSRLFRLMKDDHSVAFIHFFLAGHNHIKEMLSLRDYLRVNPEEVLAYSKLKYELYAKYQDDYSLYRKYKDEYMVELKKRTLAKLA